MTNDKGLWACDIAYCEFIYNPTIGDPDRGIPPGIRFEDLPDTWKCPKCDAGKELFHPYYL